MRPRCKIKIDLDYRPIGDNEVKVLVDEKPE